MGAAEVPMAQTAQHKTHADSILRFAVVTVLRTLGLRHSSVPCQVRRFNRVSRHSPSLVDSRTWTARNTSHKERGGQGTQAEQTRSATSGTRGDRARFSTSWTPSVGNLGYMFTRRRDRTGTRRIPFLIA